VPDGPVDWRTLRDAAAHSLAEGRLDEAETRYLGARQAAEAAGASDEEMSDLLLDLLDVLVSQDKHDEATQVGEEWLAALERFNDPNHPMIGMALKLLASTAAARGDAARARTLFRRSRAILEAALGRMSPEVADCLMDNAALHVDQGHADDAVPLYRRALAIRETELGPDTPDVAEALLALGRCYRALDDYNDARRYLRRALATTEHVFGTGSTDAAEAAQELAELYMDDDDFEEATPLLNRALIVLEEHLGPNSPEVAYCLQNLSAAYSGRNQHEPAFFHFRRAVAIYETDQGQDDPDLPKLYEHFAELAEAAGRPDEAPAARARAEELRRKPPADGNPAG